MKILFVSTSIEMFNRFLAPHVLYLTQQGHEVSIACNIDHEIPLQLLENKIQVHNAPFHRQPFHKNNLVAYRMIKAIVRDGNYNLVHVHNPTPSFITRFAMRKVKNAKALYTSHGFNFYKGCPFPYSQFFYLLEKIAARWTDGIVTINEEDYIAAKKLPLREKDNVFFMHGTGVNFKKFNPDAYPNKSTLRKVYGYTDTDFILISIADLNENKHQDLLFNMINLLKNSIPNIKLLLVGEGPDTKKYKEQVDKLGITENVHFLGYRKDIPELLKISDILVSASRREGLGVSLIEAMAMGLPIIVTDNRGHRELIKNGENGFLVCLNETKEFSKVVMEMFYSENLRIQFKEKNFKVIQQFSIENVLKELNDVYPSIMVK